MKKYILFFVALCAIIFVLPKIILFGLNWFSDYQNQKWSEGLFLKQDREKLIISKTISINNSPHILYTQVHNQKRLYDDGKRGYLLYYTVIQNKGLMTRSFKTITVNWEIKNQKKEEGKYFMHSEEKYVSPEEFEKIKKTSLNEAIKNRRSIRKFNQDMPSDEDIIKIISAGNEAPSATNKQAWRFIIIKDKDILHKIKQAIDKKVLDMKEYVRSEYQEKFVGYSKFYFYDAPVYIVPIYNTASYLENLLEDCKYMSPSKEKDAKCSLISISFAVQNMLLMIYELGLGTVFIGGALIADTEIKQVLSIPDGWEIQGLIPVGHPDETPERPEKKAVDKVIKWM